MGTWLATVRFPDGDVRYADYSTVVEAVYEGLYAGVCRVGDTAESGYVCHRAETAGDRLPSFPERPLAPIEDLVLVTIEREPDDTTWHALYCPNRARLVGPHSPHYRYHLQEEFDLVPDQDGVRHLCRGGGSAAECGAHATGEPLGLYYPSWGMGEPPADYPDAPEAPDLFAEWDAPDLCRPCFLAWLTKPEPVAEAPAEPVPDVPEPVRWRRWWPFRR
jgi:hypothetical protein